MTLKLKALGVALIALSAVGALASATAQANNITASQYPTRLTGTQTATEHGKLMRFTIGNGARFIECPQWSIEATLTGEATKLTTTVTNNTCFSNGLTAVPATIKQNGCSHTFEMTSKTTGQATIDCPEGKFIEISLYENETRHKENKPLCRYDVKAQGPITGSTVAASNVGTKTEDLLLTLNVEKVKMTNTVGSLAVCGIAAEKEGFGTLKGTATLTGETDNAEKAHVAIMVA